MPKKVEAPTNGDSQEQAALLRNCLGVEEQRRALLLAEIVKFSKEVLVFLKQRGFRVGDDFSEGTLNWRNRHPFIVMQPLWLQLKTHQKNLVRVKFSLGIYSIHNRPPEPSIISRLGADPSRSFRDSALLTAFEQLHWSWGLSGRCDEYRIELPLYSRGFLAVLYCDAEL